MLRCREEILCGVEAVEPIGLAGQIIVFGKKAEAVLTGKSEEDTVIAVAELGKGRIMVFSHGGYGKQLADQASSFANSTLYKNARNWLTKKNVNTGYKILKLDTERAIKTLAELKSFDILVSIGVRESAMKALVEEYVESGGALVVAVTPWGWQQGNINQPLSNIPYCDIILKSGIMFAKGIVKDHGTKFIPKKSMASTANLSRIHSECKEMNHVLEKCSLIRLIDELPTQCFNLKEANILQHWKEAEMHIRRLTEKGTINTKTLRDKNLFDYWTVCAKYHNAPGGKAPCIEAFPGDFSIPPVTTNKSVMFAAVEETTFPTGCYVAAGTIALIRITSITSHWKVLIGAHTDYLEAPQVTRWPDLVKKIDVGKTGEINISSPFGGGVYLISSKAKDSKIEATLYNIVLAPLYDSRDEKSKRTWPENRCHPGLWADLIGKYVMFTFPSKSIRSLEDPSKVLAMYDQLICAYCDLVGVDVEMNRKMWVVADQQPSAGYMHAGYPIVTQMDVTIPNDEKFLLDVSNFKKGNFWGLFHEMGHNMQQSHWTFEGTGEVTVNIFTLYGMQVFCNMLPWTHPWLKKQMQAGIRFLKNGADFNKWKKHPGLALIIYAQLAHHFGWEAYKKVFRSYNNMTNDRKPKVNQDKIDFWFHTFSNTVGYDLQPLVMFWGIPLSSNCVKDLQGLNLKCFLPDDEVTITVPERVKLVKNTFPKLIQRI